MTRSRTVTVEIAVAWPQRQRLEALAVDEGATVGDVLSMAATLLGPDAPADAAPVGIWGSPVARTRRVEAGDRIEIYRALPADPRETRRRLAREGATMGARPRR